MKYPPGCRIRGRATDFEIPRLGATFYLFYGIEPGSFPVPVLAFKPLRGAIIIRRHRQVGSLAGAAHLLKDNTGVLR